MAKEMMYRGMQIEELKKLDVRSFAKLVTSRERRSLLRQFQDVENFVARCKATAAQKKAIRTHKRGVIIVPQMIDMNIHVHNGNSYVPVQITWEMLGHRLGEFAPTRQKVKHGTAGIGATRSSASKSVK